MSDSNVVFRFFVEKLGGTHIGKFDPKYGEIFYDPALRELRIADGVTPGGLPLFADFVTGNYDGGSSTSTFGAGDLFLDGGSAGTLFNNSIDGGTA